MHHEPFDQSNWLALQQEPGWVTSREELAPRRRLTDAELAEARSVIAAQLATRPADGDIGISGALARAGGVRDANGRRVSVGEELAVAWPGGRSR
jgi:hypothetical protein